MALQKKSVVIFIRGKIYAISYVLKIRWEIKSVGESIIKIIRGEKSYPSFPAINQ